MWKTFSSPVDARLGQLGIFVGLRVTLGGTAGKHLHVENVLQGLCTRKVFFGKLFCSCCGPIGAIRHICGPLWDAKGTEGENCHAKISPQIMYPKLFSGIFWKTCPASVVTLTYNHISILNSRYLVSSDTLEHGWGDALGSKSHNLGLNLNVSALGHLS